MSLLRKLVLGLALAAFLVVAIVFGWLLYRHWTRPTISRDGGTILVYEVDREQSSGEFSPEELAQTLRRRLDPAEIYGIGVRPMPEERVEVSVPRSGGDHARVVMEVKNLIARVGVLEFRILANTDDDAEGIDLAANNPANLEKRKVAAIADKAPPPPNPPDGKAFVTPLGPHTYSWIELGPQERTHYGLDNATGETAGEGSFWHEMAEAQDAQGRLAHRRRWRPLPHQPVLQP